MAILLNLVKCVVLWLAALCHGFRGARGLRLHIASSSDCVSSLWIRFNCTRSELLPTMRVSSMC